MSIRFEQITKRYEGVAVVNDVTLEVATGEFFVLLGPSGGGKSTLLRAVAGLTSIDHGRISLHGRDVTHVRARDRGVGFVFQHYALFRHMTVGENIEFALRIRNVRRAERKQRRAELLKLVALDGLDDRLPGQLSGGQQQRVAVARALAHEPSMLLLDEPFGALDAKIRGELRETVKNVQRRLGTTTILVTHDQEEAFALADRIGIMRNGRLLETGTPEHLYRRPATRFVATFLGAANLLLGEVTPQGLELGGALVARHDALRAPLGERREVITVVRPEDFEIAESEARLENRPVGRGVVRAASFAGSHERIHVELAENSTVRTALGADRASPRAHTRLEVTRTMSDDASVRFTAGQHVAVGIRRLHVLPTPISSFLLFPTSGIDVATLREAPLVKQLAGSMQARVDEPLIDDVSGAQTRDAGIVVLDANPASIEDILRLASQGTRRFLCASPRGTLPSRVLVLCNTDGARPAAFAMLASVLRHLPAEATFVSLQDTAASRGEVTTSYRRLLDARAELQATHGLDLRTDLHLGDLDRWVASVVAERDTTLVIAGIEGEIDTLSATLEAHLAPLLATDGPCSLLVAYSAAGEFTTGTSQRRDSLISSVHH